MMNVDNRVEMKGRDGTRELVLVEQTKAACQALPSTPGLSRLSVVIGLECFTTFATSRQGTMQ